MLHGNPTWSFYYRHLIDALRGSYRVIVPDHIGCGLSDKPDDSRTLTRWPAGSTTSSSCSTTSGSIATSPWSCTTGAG